jgi:hypothetical protein
MPLTAEQETLCQRLETGRPEPSAAALIRELAKEVDDLWDRLNAAYAFVRNEMPEGAIQDEMRRLQAMVRQRTPERGS